jgi:hypothetical protein
MERDEYLRPLESAFRFAIFNAFHIVSQHFNITKHVVFENNNSLLHVLITLHVSFLLMDHHQAFKYITNTHLCMHVECY